MLRGIKMAIEKPKVILTGFMDEGTRHRNKKDILEQMMLLQALGLSYYTPRALSIHGRDEKNVADLTDSEVTTLVDIHKEYGAKVSSLGTGIGKTKLNDENDGSTNKYEAPEKTKERISRAVEIADKVDTKLLRCFSFYPPKDSDLKRYIGQAVERLAPLVEICEKGRKIYGLEVESNLTGHDAASIMEIYRQINKPATLGIVYDGANLVVQRIDINAVEEFELMMPGLTWMHIKDYRMGAPVCEGGHVPEDMLKHFVPADVGRVNHHAIFEKIKGELPKYVAALSVLGVPGFFLDLEPHLKGGGQFGGYSGPDGMFVALTALRRVLDDVGITYQMRSYDTLVCGR